MKDGKKQKIVKSFIKVLYNIMLKNVFFNFFHDFKFFSKIFYKNNFFYLKNQFNVLFSPISNKPIQTISPVFTFFIQKVNKKIQKYSRGKSGKYVLS